MRVNDRIQIDDPGFANRLWLETGLKELVIGEDEDEGMTAEEKRKMWYVAFHGKRLRHDMVRLAPSSQPRI